MVEIIWREPPPSISSEKAEVLAELQKNPGRWALVQQDKSSSGSAAPWQRIGCQARAHRKNPGEMVRKYDVYARWPDATAGAANTAAAASPSKAPAVEKAISTGTALKPPAPATRPALPAPKASGGYSQFLANQRAGTVAAAAE